MPVYQKGIHVSTPRVASRKISPKMNRFLK